MSKSSPPPVIAGMYVLEFAHADRTVRFEQRQTLNVGGKWLGRVPFLVICVALEKTDKTEFAIQHCDRNWYPLGIAGGYKSVKEAKERIERSYHGISKKWTKQSISKRKARALYEAELKAESCSFCGRVPFEVISMVAGSTVSICNYCVESFHEMIHPNRGKIG